MTEKTRTIPKAIYFKPRQNGGLRVWIKPLLLILLAIVMSVLVPFFDRRIPFHTSYFSISTANLLLSTIAGGMISFTGIVLSLAFIFLQYSSSMYTPRLASSFFEEPVYQDSIGIFIGTFMFSLLTLAGRDFGLYQSSLDLSMVVALLWLMASMISFLCMIQRVALLQVDCTIKKVGDEARLVLEEMYPEVYQFGDDNANEEVEKIRLPELSQIVYYRGGPQSILSINYRRLAQAARRAGGIIEMDYSVGDTVANGAPLFRLCGAENGLRIYDLRRSIRFSAQRSINQDPRYAMRLLVDIAVRALSAAINDPTTAVQTLDQLDDLLRRIGTRKLDQNSVKDSTGTIRVRYPTPDWDDYLSLAVEEIRIYGASTMQVTRRLQALLEDLHDTVPEIRKSAVDRHIWRLRESVKTSFKLQDDQITAQSTDRQGIGMTRELIDFDNAEEKV